MAMPEHNEIVEGEKRKLSDVVTTIGDSDDIVTLSKLVGHKNRRLQADLGLRAKPIQLDITSEPTITIYGIAGTLELGKLRIDIAPKYLASEGANRTNWQDALIVMLEVASRGKVTFSSAPSFAKSDLTFVDRLAFAYASELRIARRGPQVRQYRLQEEQGRVLRGHLRVTEQMRLSLTRPDLVAYERDQLDTDNDANRLLHWAAQRLLSGTRHAETMRFLRAEVSELPHTRNVRPSRTNVHLPRQFSNYRGAVSLASTIAKNQGIVPGLASLSGADFLVGTEKLFEAFLEARLAKIASETADWRMLSQSSERFAVSKSGLRSYFSRPDDLLKVSGAAALVIDAKYKRFSDQIVKNAKKPTNGDLYQMVAACIAHKTTRALLVYPRMTMVPSDETPVDDLDLPVDEIAWWTVDMTNGEFLHVGAARVDLTVIEQLSDLRAFDQSLLSLVQVALLEVPRDRP